ncbi:MAG: C-type lectin domain-containing protein, partial [Bacteroidota bacterium]
MRSLLLSLVLLAVLPATSFAQGSSYIYVSTPMTYADAEAHAASLGGTLPIITSAAENATVLATIGIPEFHSWIGLNDRASEGTFVWIDGTPVAYTNWGGIQPDNFNNEDCGMILGVFTTNVGAAGQWNDAMCTAQLRFVVELPPATSTLEITGSEGWRMISASFPGTTYDDLLGPIWTQGFPGSDAPDANYPNVYTYDETVTTDTNNDGTIDKVDGYVPIANQASGVPAGEGHFVYVYADDDFDGTPDDFPKVSVQSSVLLNPDPFSFPVTFSDSPADDVLADGWNMFGNPWATGMDWDAVGWTRTNVTNTLYVWDHNNAGGPQYVSWNGIAGGMASGVIEPHQGFWAKASAAGPALQAPSAAKVAGGTPYNVTETRAMASAKAGGAPVLGLRVEGDLGGVRRANGAWATFLPEASVGVDDWDAFELEGWAPERIHLYWDAPDGIAYDVAALPMSRRTTKLPLAVTAMVGGVPAGGTFTLTWPQLDVPADWQLVLVDRETRERIPLDGHTAYTFTLDGPVVPPSAKATDRPLAPEAPGVLRSRETAKSADRSRFVLVIRTGRRARLSDAEADSMAEEVLGVTTQARGADAFVEAPPEALALHAPSPNPTRGPVALHVRRVPPCGRPARGH